MHSKFATLTLILFVGALYITPLLCFSEESADSVYSGPPRVVAELGLPDEK